MDKPILTAILLSAVSISVFGQELNHQTPERKVKKEIRSEKETPPQNSGQTLSSTNAENTTTYPQEFSVDQNGVKYTHDKAYFEQRIVEIDELMQAIEMKEEYVRSNPAEHAIAVKNGWYDDMTRTKERLKEDKKALQKKIDSL